jgi:hypothetical protein
MKVVDGGGCDACAGADGGVVFICFPIFSNFQ